jgi:hypothetical protein
LYNIIKDPHHCDSLLFAEPLGLEPLNELQRIEMMVALSWSRSMERPPGGIESCDVDAIMPNRVARRLCELCFGGD